jgi:putative hydrolase of the HAD superfamily
VRKDIEAVAFDLDGTLYPNYKFNAKLIPFLLKELRLIKAFGKARSIIRKEQEEASFMPSSISGDNFYRHQAGIMEKLLGDRQDVLQEKIERLIYRGWEPLFKTVKLYKNALQTLAALREKGYKLGLLSDFPPETKLENLGISGLWDAVLCSEQFGALKPHPLSFQHLAKTLSLPPEKILYVGNSYPYDVIGAAGAGMKTAWIKSHFSPGGGLKKKRADFTFSNYRQLYDFMLD